MKLTRDAALKLVKVHRFQVEHVTQPRYPVDLTDPAAVLDLLVAIGTLAWHELYLAIRPQGLYPYPEGSAHSVNEVVVSAKSGNLYLPKEPRVFGGAKFEDAGVGRVSHGDWYLDGKCPRYWWSEEPSDYDSYMLLKLI